MFMYFIEGAGASVSLKQLQDAGLGYAFDANPMSRVVTAGPNGTGGAVVASQDRMRVLGPVDKDGNPGPATPLAVKYKAEEQTWVESPLPGVWIGWWNAYRPTPQSLQRPEDLLSYPLEMCDGQVWRFPSVREADPDSGEAVCQLPSHYRMTPQRKLVPDKPLDRIAWLWDATEAAWQAMVSGQDTSDNDLVELAGLLLSANYYASDIELGALGAFGQTTAGSPASIVSLCLGYRSWKKWKEALEAEGK